MAKLIYGNKETLGTIGDLAPDARMNVADLSVTRNLTKADCLMISVEKLTRGIDYRAKGVGIALLIGKQLTSDRALD